LAFNYQELPFQITGIWINIHSMLSQ